MRTVFVTAVFWVALLFASRSALCADATLTQRLADTYWSWPDLETTDDKGWIRFNGDGTATAGWNTKSHSWKAIDGSTIEYEVTSRDRGKHRLRFNQELTEATQDGTQYSSNLFTGKAVFHRLLGPKRVAGNKPQVQPPTSPKLASDSGIPQRVPPNPQPAPPPATPAPIAKIATPAPRAPTPTPPPKIDRIKTDPLEGRWRQNNSTVTTILPNGYAKNNAPGKPQYDGTWTQDGSGYVINWNGGLFVDHVMIRSGDELWRKGGDNRWREMAKRLR